MNPRNESQRRAMFARMSGSTRGVHGMLGATRADRRQLVKRVAIGTAVSGAALGTALLARRSSPLLGRWARRLGFAAGGGTLASAYTTARENLEAHRRRASGAAHHLRSRGAATLRTIPVEALVAKGVDSGFGAAESLLHRRATHHLSELEGILGGKLGGYQSLATAHLASQARGMHRKYLPQPTAADAPEIRAWMAAIDPPNLSELSRRRTLRTGHVNRRVDASARAVWKQLASRGDLQRLLLTGEVNPSVLTDVANQRGHKDTRELLAIANRVRQFGLTGTGGHL